MLSSVESGDWAVPARIWADLIRINVKVSGRNEIAAGALKETGHFFSIFIDGSYVRVSLAVWLEFKSK